MNHIHIGYTKKTHGIKGWIKLHIFDEYLEDTMQAEVIFVEQRGRNVPFFLDDIQVGNHILAKFEDTDTKESAQAIVGKSIFLREEDILEAEDRQMEVEGLFYRYLTGYTLIDTEQGTIGVIEDVIELPQQEMAVITYQEKEILIPLNEQFVRKIDKEKQTVEIELPDGLLTVSG